MTSWNFRLAGMLADPNLWHPQELLQYLLIIAVIDSLSGATTARLISCSQVFGLTRCGYRRWYRYIISVNGVIVFAYTVLLFLLTTLGTDHCSIEAVIASSMFFLNTLMLIWFQTLLTIIFESILLGFISIVLVQLISLYGSNHLSGNWKLLLPGNWSMVCRSTWATPDGYSANIAILLEFALLLSVWICGWRLVRWHTRKA